MSTQWTDTDNAHALGGAACTHQNEVAELKRELDDIRCPLSDLGHESQQLQQHYCPNLGRVAALQSQVKQLKEALRETGPTMDYFLRKRIIDDAIGALDRKEPKR